MSFYTVIKTELSSKKYLVCALEELKKRGEITGFVENVRKDTVEVDRDGDIISMSQEKTGNYQMAGDNRVVGAFSNRLKQIYAYESIKDNLPLDFEIASETETAGEIQIVLKG
ncbi:MAG TPA: hypothetical protein DDW94_12135 [Deltaproteobacteria bacterium]|nr:MAG: hypothetical protein A2Z79_08280 [Deltaproteobacteria bacterium GWA2_55_82]OGQ63120.1 MAG: hypothetical protein A3I81_09910 [Deltaproteobacteria bacterium RIFCSPLOWO2_02_FULL_55_12]OIJ73584.1 MAG: hypothetical protein A2V21_304475 [Deltaproteobacteria bacterium GWC2_55_46]HBG47717.1 hypothetical protein [Deltaproteobacteria bacterium]HCY12061.1 hypothetical protein [Deltaproteobacteria bacterium]